MNPFLALELVKLSSFYYFVWQAAPHPNDFLQEKELPDIYHATLSSTIRQAYF